MENVHADVRVWSVNLVIFLLVMVSIWEGNQCKKAQLTLMEISAAIANKVVSHVFFFFYILVVSLRIMCRQLLYFLICHEILAIDCPSSPFI